MFQAVAENNPSLKHHLRHWHFDISLGAKVPTFGESCFSKEWPFRSEHKLERKA